MKKVFNTFLVLFCLLVIFGCKRTEYSLEIEIPEKVYEGMDSNLIVKLMPTGTVVTEYEVSSSNDEIFTATKSKVTGVKEGDAVLKVTLVLTDELKKSGSSKQKTLTAETNVHVNKKEVEKNYALDVDYKDALSIGGTCKLTLKERNSGNEITEYEVFSVNPTIAIYEDGVIKALSEGTAEFKVSCYYDEVLLTKTISIKISKQSGEVEKDYALDVDYKNALSIGDTCKLALKEKNSGNEITEYEVYSANPTIAIYEDGVIKALSEGTAEFKVSCYYDEVLLTKTISIKISGPSEFTYSLRYFDTMQVGEKCRLEIFDKNDEIVSNYKVETLNEEIATFDKGIINCLSKGEASFKISVGEDGSYQEKTIKIQVVQFLNELEINIPMNIYEGLKFIFEVKTSEGKVVNNFSVETSDEDILFYDEDSNTFEAYEVGKVTLTVTAEIDGLEVSCEFDINVYKGYQLNIEIKNEIVLGSKEKIKVYVTPGMIYLDEFEVSFSKNDILKFENQEVVALARGKTRLYVKANYNDIEIQKFVDIEVVRNINYELEVNIFNYLFVGSMVEAKANIRPFGEQVENFKILSSDESVVKVDGTTVSALKQGKVVLTFTGTYNGNEYKLERELEVYDFTGIKIEIKKDLLLNEVCSYDVYALPNNVKLYDFDINLNNEGILLVSTKNVFANGVGSVTIEVSYKYLDKVYKASEIVTVQKNQFKLERIFVEGSKGILEGTETNLQVTTYPKNVDCKIKFKTSDEKIATVDDKGLVKAISLGKCVITCYDSENENVYTIHNITIIEKKDMSVINGNTGTSTYQGRYYEESIKYYYELMNGIKETTYYGYTSSQTPNMDVDGLGGLSQTSEIDKFYPQNVHVLEVPSSKNVKIVPWANLEGHEWTLTTVKGFIKTYEDKNPGKKVICAINGDFFDIKALGDLPYQTTGENVTDGEFYRTSNGHGAGGTLGFTNNGTADSLIADGKAERTPYLVMAIYDENNNIVKELPIENINTEPEDGQSSVYYGLYKSHEYQPKEFTTEGTCFIVENAELALPNSNSDFYGLGTITSTEVKKLEKGSFAITTKNKEVIDALKVGVRIRVQYEFIGKFKDVTGATGYNNLIYSDVNNMPSSYIADRAPRTVIGKKADGTLVMMVVDGRQAANNMYGCDGSELSAIMSAYGCVNAYNLDGGGSSTIVVRDESGLNVLNSPSDGRERSDGNCLLVVADDPNYVCEEVEVTSTKAVLSVKTFNENLKNKTPYLLVNGKYYEAENGLVTIDNLVHNTTYDYRVCYKDGDQMIESLTVGSFTAKKSGFKFLGITLQEDDNYYLFKAYYIDEDHASNCSSILISLNGDETYFANDEIKLSKEMFGYYIETVKFKYWYEDDINKYDVTVNDYFYINN